VGVVADVATVNTEEAVGVTEPALKEHVTEAGQVEPVPNDIELVHPMSDVSVIVEVFELRDGERGWTHGDREIRYGDSDCERRVMASRAVRAVHRNRIGARRGRGSGRDAESRR